MPIISLNDVSGGIRKLGQRTFPQNAVKDALNIIPNIDNSIFVTQDNISLKFSCSLNLPIVSAIVVDIDGKDTIFFAQLDESTNTIYIRKFDGAETAIESYTVGDNKNPLNLIRLASGFISHNSLGTTVANIRRLYVDGDYPQFSGLVPGNNGYSFYPLPSIITDYRRVSYSPYSDVAFNVNQFISGIDTADDVPLIISLTENDKQKYYKIGKRFDGFQSICGIIDEAREFSDEGTDEDVSTVACIKVMVGIKNSVIEKRVSGFDIYLSNNEPIYQLQSFNDNDSNNWLYVDVIEIDQDIEYLDFGSQTFAGGSTVTISGTPTWIADIYIGMVLSVGSTDYRITDNDDAGLITVGGTFPTGSFEAKISGKWIYNSTSGRYECSKYLSSVSGEALFYKCGVSDRKISTIDDYCPPANICEYFKGRVWLADYLEYGDTRRKNRLIYNVINSDGLSCYDVYNVEEYVEFSAPIYFLKASSDYMLVFTADGIYSIRFLPSTESYSVNWTVKKVSDNIIINNKNLCWTSKSLTFVFDGSTIYVFDGNFFKSMTNDEHSNLLRDYVTTNNMTDLDYSMFFSEADDSVILLLDKCIRLKNGILIYDFTYDPLDRSIVVNGKYNGENLFFNARRCYSMNKFDEIGNVYSFNIETLDNDLGIKNEKYFNSAYIEYLKNGVEVYLYIYIDNVLVTGGAITLSSSVLSGTKEILPPKSKSRRFTSIRYRIEGNDGVESQFRLKSFDIDVDPIKRRRGTSNG